MLSHWGDIPDLNWPCLAHNQVCYRYTNAAIRVTRTGNLAPKPVRPIDIVATLSNQLNRTQPDTISQVLLRIHRKSKMKLTPIDAKSVRVAL